MSTTTQIAQSRLKAVHRELEACRLCPKVVGPPVHGPPVVSKVVLIGQAPGVREAALGRPFAWTAGKTLFRWLEGATGANEDVVRTRIYISAVARCFPGKDPKGGDRKPSPDEIERCRPFLQREIEILRPTLLIPVGTMAIEQVLGEKLPLVEVVGTRRRVRFHGVSCDVIALPHPSGASTWHVMEPGKALLAKALALLAAHPAMRRALGGKGRKTNDLTS